MKGIFALIGAAWLALVPAHAQQFPASTLFGNPSASQAPGRTIPLGSGCFIVGTGSGLQCSTTAGSLATLNGGPLSINPTAGTTNQGYLVNQTMSGAGTGTVAGNRINVTESVASGVVPEFSFSQGTGQTSPIGYSNLTANSVNMIAGGATGTGARFASLSQLFFNTASSPTNGVRYYSADVALTFIYANDNGTALSPQGIAYSNASTTYIGPLVTHWKSATGFEHNIAVAAGAAVDWKTAFHAIQLDIDAVSGSLFDVAYMASNNSGTAPGWSYLFASSNMAGSYPLKSTGTFMAAIGAQTFANGVDFSAATITGCAYKSPGICVTGDGRYAFGGLTSSFPVIERSGTAILLKLADGSAFTNIGASSFIGLTAASTGVTILPQSDGVLSLRNFALTDFSRLQFGGTTSSFPAIKRSSTALLFRLADDSAATNIGALEFVLTANAGGVLTLAMPVGTVSINMITFPAGTTNFGSTGGVSQVIKQTSAGGAFTVARLACADLSDAATTCSSATGESLVVGTTPITSGTTTRILYNNAGILGEYTVSGSGTVVALATGATLTTVVASGVWTASGTWTLPAHILGGTVSGGGNQINNVVIGTTTPLAGTFTAIIGTSASLTAQSTINLNAASPPTALTGTIFRAVGVDATTSVMEFVSSGGAVLFAGRRSGNTLASPSATVTGTVMIALQAYGYDTAWGTAAKSTISILAAETWASGANGTKMVFQTTPIGSTTTATNLTLSDVGMLTTSALDATSTSTGAIQNPGGMSVNKRVWMNGLTTASASQTAYLCQASTGEIIADTSAVNLCVASSERFKTPLIGIGDAEALAKVIQLQPSVGRYKPEGIFTSEEWQREHVWFSAEKVEKIDHRLVSYGSDGQVYSIDYTGVFTLYAGAIRQLKADNDNLRTANENLQEAFITCVNARGIMELRDDCVHTIQQLKRRAAR